MNENDNFRTELPVHRTKWVVILIAKSSETIRERMRDRKNAANVVRWFQRAAVSYWDSKVRIKLRLHIVGLRLLNMLHGIHFSAATTLIMTRQEWERWRQQQQASADNDYNDFFLFILSLLRLLLLRQLAAQTTALYLFLFLFRFPFMRA